MSTAYSCDPNGPFESVTIEAPPEEHEKIFKDFQFHHDRHPNVPLESVAKIMGLKIVKVKVQP